MEIAIGIFAVSLIGLITLFTVKSWELSHNRLMAAPIRRSLDQRALAINTRVQKIAASLDNIPSHFWYLVRYVLHVLAVAIGLLARWVERQAHRLANFLTRHGNRDNLDR